MSEVNKNISPDVLACLRGIGSGGVQASQPKQQDSQPHAQSDGSVENQERVQEVKPKRDIQELYNFIDAYCSPEE